LTVIDKSGDSVHWQRFGRKLLSTILRSSKAERNMATLSVCEIANQKSMPVRAQIARYFSSVGDLFVPASNRFLVSALTQ
jgi:hypothetical protein